MTNPDREELVKLDEAGLEAAVRECARITAPEITDDEYEQIKTDNSPRYQNTRDEMARAIRAYLRAAKPALSSIVTCCVTGAIPGDGGACGDCDPCLLGEASVPAPVKTLIAEKNSLLHRVGELEGELESLRRLASSDSVVKVRELEWRGPVDAFPTTIWEAKTAFGHYVIEEVSASDSPAYEVRFAGGRVISVKDGLNDAKAAAQADYEARIRSALVEAAAVKGEPEPVADWRDDPTSDERWNAGCDFAMTQLCKALDVDPATVNWDAATETVDGDVQSVIWNILRARMGEDWDPDTAPPADAGMREALDASIGVEQRLRDVEAENSKLKKQLIAKGQQSSDGWD